ncbi:MAG: YiiX/YebB-like N1pC/P60 family cysteine hydrolase [Micropepsaceae bacterium]
MKGSVAAIFGGVGFAVVLGAYLWSYATTARDPVEWKTGDLIVQRSRVAQVLPLFAADGSGMTHMGIVDASPADGVVVIEVTDVVRETPIREFLARDEGIGVYRLEALSDAQRLATVAAARRQLGKPADYFLRRSWDAFYPSELARLAYGDIGFDLGRTQKLSSVASDLSGVKSQFGRRWNENADCNRRHLDQEQCWVMVAKQEVITPANIVGDSQLTKVYSSLK